MIDRIKAHLRTLPPHVTSRMTASLLAESMAEIEQLRGDLREQMDRADDAEDEAEAREAKVRRIMSKTYLYHCMNLVDFINGGKMNRGTGTCEDTIMEDVDQAKATIVKMRIALMVSCKAADAAKGTGE